MEYVVLGLLMIQSMTLYELNQAFKHGISLFYSASYGSLQAAVKSLLGKGLIVFEEKVESGRNKKIYSITEAGKRAFSAWMREEVPASKLEVAALSRVFFLGLVPDAEERKQIVAGIVRKIEAAQAELEQMDAEIRRAEIPERYQGILKFQLKTLDYGIQAHAFGRQWFQGLLDELEKASR